MAGSPSVNSASAATPTDRDGNGTSEPQHGPRALADWPRRYAERVRTLDDAVSLVRPDDRVMGGLPEPTAFLERLGSRDDLRRVEGFLGAPRTGGAARGAPPPGRPPAAVLPPAGAP